MADLLMDLAEYLQSSSLVLGEGTDVFCDFMPDKPDNAVFLFEYTGPETPTGTTSLVRMVQVKVRTAADTPDVARQQAWRLFNFLDNPMDRTMDRREETVPKDRWAVIQAKGTPSKIETDPSKRAIYGFNVSMVTYRD